jgi:hypothetical protein
MYTLVDFTSKIVGLRKSHTPVSNLSLTLKINVMFCYTALYK